MTMKLRNRLLALACLLLFLTLGGLIFLTTGARKPFAVILFVADNINPTCLTATRLYSGGGDTKLQLEEFPNTALCRNASSDFSVPDTAAAATEIAAGAKVPNGKLCQDAAGSKLPSLLETASLKGRSTALITTGGLLSPSAASFYAKTADPSNLKEIQEQFRTHQPFDMTVGFSGDQELSTNSFPKDIQLIGSPADLEAFPFWKRNPVAAQLPSPTEESVNTEEPISLSDLVRIAIRRLQLNGKGYLLVVDDPGIAAAAETNNGEKMLRRISAFDKAIATARRYAGDKAMIVVTGRENIGGLQLNGRPFLHDKGVAVVALNNMGYPSLCWSTGPGYAVEAPQEGKTKKGVPGILTQPSAFLLPKGIPTSGDVLTVGIGQGTEKIHGFLDLTDLHRIIRESL
jgi:alkaline phosphatase